MGRVGARRPAFKVFVVLGRARRIPTATVTGGGISRMRNQHAQVPAGASTRYRNALRVNTDSCALARKKRTASFTSCRAPGKSA